MIESDGEERVIRVRPKSSIFWIGVGSLTLYLSMLCFAAFDHFVRGGNVPIVFVTTVFGLFAALSIWMIVYSMRAVVKVDAQQLLLRGAFVQRRVAWAELTAVEWNWQGSIVVLRTLNDRIRIDVLRTFDWKSAMRLIEFIHDYAPANGETGWAEYVHQVALPLRKRGSARPDSINTKTHIWSTRKRVDVFMGAVAVVFALLGVSLAVWLNQPKFATFPVPILMLWGLLRFSTPKHGEPVPRLNRQTRESKYVSWMCWLVLLSIVGVLAAKLFGAPEPLLVTCGAIGFFGAFWLSWKVDRERVKEVQEQADGSLREWQQRY